MNVIKRASSWRVLFLSVFLFTGCAVSLAPKFDQKIVDDVSASSSDIFQFFEKISAGTKPADFSSREEKYDQLIGKTEALQLQILARPVPKNKAVDKIIKKANDRLSSRNVGTLITVGDESPSATALTQITKNIVQMKKTDQENGLTPTAVATFKGFIQLYLDQALTYERYLNN